MRLTGGGQLMTMGTDAPLGEVTVTQQLLAVASTSGGSTGLS